MPAPLITIGITAYNAQDSIARAVESAQAQDWPHKEIIVYDDASSDETVHEIKKFPDVKLVRGEKNEGVAHARNQIIEHASGDFLAFFDDDDQSTPERLKLQYERLIRYEHDYAQGAPVICYSARIQSYPDGADRYEPTPGCDTATIAPHGLAMAKRILFGTPVAQGFGSMPTCSQMARLSTYKALEGFDPAFRRSEDTEFNVRLAMAGGHFAGVAAPLVRQSMTYGSEKILATEEMMMKQLLAKYQDFIEEHSDYNFCRRWIETKYDYLRGHKALFVRKLSVLALSNPALTIQRLMWALPNRTHHKAERRFHQSEAA